MTVIVRPAPAAVATWECRNRHCRKRGRPFRTIAPVAQARCFDCGALAFWIFATLPPGPSRSRCEAVETVLRDLAEGGVP